MSKKDTHKKHARTDAHTPSCFKTHLPILEGRNLPALKIDMTRERSRAAAEKGACRKGRKMAAGSVDQCIPDWAYGHTSYSLPSVAMPGPAGLPCPAAGLQGCAKGPPTSSSGPSSVSLPGVKDSSGGHCPNNTPMEVNLGTA